MRLTLTIEIELLKMKRLIVHDKQSVWKLQSLIGIVLDNNTTKIWQFSFLIMIVEIKS